MTGVYTPQRLDLAVLFVRWGHFGHRTPMADAILESGYLERRR